mmetsp:Transcript_47018/g.98604  ORF Transcript_47018/g.98604 Transcript_47018/m.98604 type:complete len:1018 (-) Transcript_47018:48-3101(-)|eukprot:CAMPEP_0183722174 /NCGR_PEP_ID=MMETSP0737-20130205/14208_1 /TAXON_ID=385413 /ORGANISM="Thalassiosira miniscula, Strain CCMP1093" /LENGTH=1017 /DNA_ID=CAMNT_0025952291 /DNA_START=347 /DNA_END=3400 /DNA_ORIENTATION=-
MTEIVRAPLASSFSKMEEDKEAPATAAAGSATDQAPPPRFRSAIDYASQSSLQAALTEFPHNHHQSLSSSFNSSPPPPKRIKVGPCVFDGNLSTLCCDWQTAKLDLSTSHPHSMEDEVSRLMELKEYALLDSEHEEKFERITAIASRIFDAPICLVSLVDIGRQWFKSNRGLGEVRETSREVSFCAHAIHSHEDIFIIPDTFKDPRFIKNGLVTGAPFIRFYAGVPLVTSRGYKLGTFCIIDPKPRPAGLSLVEKQNLRELTEMVMDTIVHRKKEMENLMDEKTRLIACAAHDLLSPLTGIQLNLGLLMEDESLKTKLDNHQRELMEASVECSDMIERICVQAIESFRGDLNRANKTSLSSPGKEDSNEEKGGNYNGQQPSGTKGVVIVDQLVDSIERVIGTYPKKVPFFIEKGDNVPQAIVSDDLKLFRSIINYLTNACKHTQAGSIRLRIYVKKADTASVAAGGGNNIKESFNAGATKLELDLLPGALVAPKKDVFIMEVHDTGPGIELEKYPALFTPLGTAGSNNNELNHQHHHSRMTNSGLGLYSVATEISSLGGEYGVFPRQDLVASHPDNHDNDSVTGNMMDIGPAMSNGNPDQEQGVSGCVFWLSIPLVLPEGKSSWTSDASGAPVTMTMTPSPSLLDMRMAGLGKATEEEDAAVSGSLRCIKTMDTNDSRVMPEPKRNKRSHDAKVAKPTTDTNTATSNKAAKEDKETARVKRALIIDDSTTIRKGLARGFSRLGFEVDQAENGLQGFKKLKAEYYDLVLLDFLMPVMDGPDVAREFREWEKEHRPDFHQHIIGISAHANGKDAELGIKAGMDRFMGKPVPLKSLKDLAQCKPVMEASAFLDLKFKKSCDALDVAMAKADESGSSRSSVSSTASTFNKPSCLIVAREMDSTMHTLQRIVEKNGWRAVVKQGSGDDAFRLLKLRKWDTVFIDSNLPIMSGTNCLARFREWEKRSSTMQQKNIFIISDVYSHDTLPSEFDGVLRMPLDPSQVLHIIDSASRGASIREILLR